MGLFDIFKKKKEEKAEVVADNGQVQVQPEGVQVVNPVPAAPVAPAPEVAPVAAPDQAQVAPNPVSNDVATVTPEVPASMDPAQANIAGQEVPMSDVVAEAVSEASATIDNSAVPSSFAPVEGEIQNMNEVVDNSNPAEVQQINTNDEKNNSQDIVSAMEDVAALIDNPIPAKSEEENMSANPEEIINGGENNVEWQENPFKEETPAEVPTAEEAPATEETANAEETTNLVDNIVSNDQNIISSNEPMEVQDFEPPQKEDDIQDLSGAIELDKIKEAQAAQEAAEAAAQETTEENTEPVPEPDTVIKVDENEPTSNVEVEQSNIFREVPTENNTIDGEFIPIVVDEHEDDDLEGEETEESGTENPFNDDTVSDETTDFVNMISEVTSITDESIPDGVTGEFTSLNEVEETNEETEEVPQDVKSDEVEEEAEPEEKAEEESEEKTSEEEKEEEPEPEENINSFEEAEETSEAAEEEKDEEVTEGETAEEEKTEEDTEEKEEPVIIEQEEANIFNIEGEEEKEESSEEENAEEESEEEPEKKEKPKAIIRDEEEFDGPIIEEEKTFSIFDLPAIPSDSEEQKNIEEDLDNNIFNDKEESNDEDDIVVKEENYDSIDQEEEDEEKNSEEETSEEENEFEEEGPKKVEKTDDIVDMYSQLEFKNEKIRFCDNCGAMILGDTATVCPSCGEPL